MKRPVGVTILAILAIIYGAFSLLLALLGLLGSALEASGVGVAYSAGSLVYATISDAVLGILFLVFGIGAFRLKPWAWIAGVAAPALDVVRQIVGLVLIRGTGSNKIVGLSVTIVIALVLLGYLLRPTVRAAFWKSAQRPTGPASPIPRGPA